jgi:uncharacterized protein YodC (DUF2158 family)
MDTLLKNIARCFPIGSQILLKSGGPAMTVEMHRNDGLICAHGFSETELKRDGFDPLCVLVVSASA